MSGIYSTTGSDDITNNRSSRSITGSSGNEIALLTIAEFEKHLNYIRDLNERNYVTTAEKFAVVQRDTSELHDKLRSTEQKLDQATRKIAALEAESASLILQRDQVKEEFETFKKQSVDDIGQLRAKNDELLNRIRQEAIESARKDETFRSLTDDMIKTKMTAAEQADLVNQEKRKVAQLTKALEAVSHDHVATTTSSIEAPTTAEKRPSFVNMAGALGALKSSLSHASDVIAHGDLFDAESDTPQKNSVDKRKNKNKK